MELVPPKCPKKYGGCEKRLTSAMDPTKTSVERMIAEIIVPRLAVAYGLESLRTDQFICTNPECRWFYSESSKYSFNVDRSGNAIPANWFHRIGLFWPKPKKKGQQAAQQAKQQQEEMQQAQEQEQEEQQEEQEQEEQGNDAGEDEEENEEPEEYEE